MSWDLLIRRGLIIDGSGRQGVLGDVAVAGGRIAALGVAVPGDAKKIIDADGRGDARLHRHQNSFGIDRLNAGVGDGDPHYFHPKALDRLDRDQEVVPDSASNGRA